MYTEKTKNELRDELDANRAKIDAKKAELAETKNEGKILAEAAKKAGIPLTPEKYSRGDALADAFRSYGNGDEFSVSEISARSNEFSVRNGSKSNPNESETVFRNNSAFATRLGFLEKIGKDRYRKISGSILRKVVNE